VSGVIRFSITVSNILDYRLQKGYGGLPPEKWSSLRYGFGQTEDARMARKRHTAEEIVAKPRQVEVLTAQGRPVAEAVRATGVTEVTYYRRRSEYGGPKGDQVKRLKELEAENVRLRRAVSDLALEKLILKEAASGNF
jgi:putative transposase